MPLTRDATSVWKYLNGIVCIYKPPDVSALQVRKTLIGNICRDMCKLDCRPPIRHIFIESRDNSDVINVDTQLSVRVAPSFSDLINVTGPRYIPKDVKCRWGTPLGRNFSGILLMGINRGSNTARLLGEQRPLRTFHVQGRLGRSTDSGWVGQGKATAKAHYAHVPREALDRILAATQAAHQRQAFEFAGVDPQSQQAYEMAKTGVVMPAGRSGPLLYGARCISFEPPDFTLEVQSVNENEPYMVEMVAEVGRRVRSAAAVVSVRCVQHGPFSVQHALARTEWSLDKLVANMQLCAQLLHQNKEVLRQIAAA